MPTSRALALPANYFDPQNPFNGDKFARREFSQKLNPLLERMKAGCVIAIDAPWGEGKTWFSQNWNADLKSTGRKTIYIDAFQDDYIEDPFILIAAEITALVSENSSAGEDFKNKTAGVFKALIPIGISVVGGVASALIVPGLGEAVSEGIEAGVKKAEELSQEYIKERLSAYEKDKQAVQDFKDALSQYCGDQDKPVVLFIDELDRCKPVFAVTMLERIKHFFDVPNLIFVLMLNRQQLESAIRGVYGAETDATNYLNKFVHLFLTLPKDKAIDANSHLRNHNQIYITEMLNRYGFDQTVEVQQFTVQLTIFAFCFELSFREIEKAVALFSISENQNSAPYLPWLIVLKLKFPSIFEQARLGMKTGHVEALELLDSLEVPDDINFWNRTFYSLYHKIMLGGESSLTEEDMATFRSYRPRDVSYANLFKAYAKRIDIGID